MDSKFWRNGLALTFAAFLALFALAGCETTEGMEEDMEDAGEEIDETF